MGARLREVSLAVVDSDRGGDFGRTPWWLAGVFGLGATHPWTIGAGMETKGLDFGGKEMSTRLKMTEEDNCKAKGLQTRK